MADSQGNKNNGSRRTGSHRTDKRRPATPAPPQTQQHERNREVRIIQNGTSLHMILSISHLADTSLAPRFQQVTAFSQWCPPTREVEPRSSRVKPHKEVWYQTNRLMAHYPQAMLADQDTLALLSEEITNLRHIDELPVTSTTCLLATGEISDLSDPESVQGHPVLALTAGPLGDTLRLVSLAKQQWTWAKEQEVVVVLNAPDTRLEKEFVQSRGEPISSVKFALDIKRPGPIRWLIVQKASSTTIYEPELYDFGSGTDGAPPKLFSNPLATIRRTHTGGGAQSDFAFRSVSGEAPQLVIVDELGHWSLWEAGGRKAVGRPRTFELALQMHGSIYSGIIPQPLPGTARAGSNNPGSHKLLLLCAKKYRSRRQSQSMSQPQDVLETTIETTADEGTPIPFLLISTSTNLYQNDFQTEESAPVLQSYIPAGAKILDIAKSSLDPSEAFILTTKDLLWISAKETKRQGVSLDVLMACPHRKNPGAAPGPGTLRLELSPGTYINGQKGCFVCIRSRQDTQMTIFWLIKSKTEGVQYRREVIDVRAPANYIGMAMLPVDRAHREGDEVGGLAHRLAEAKARFFQILLMSKDLDVSSALCVWSDDPDLKVRPPDLQVSADDEDTRKERAGYLSDLIHQPGSSKTTDVKQEPVLGPRTVDLKIPFTFNKTGGAWQGLEFGGDSQTAGDLDLEMNDGQNPWVDKLRSLFDSLPKEANNQVESAIETMAAQILHEDIDKSALPRGVAAGTQAPESQRTNTYSSQDFFSSQFQIQSSQAVPPSSQFPPSSPGILPNENESDDPIVNYLRQYMHIDPQLPGESSSALIGPFRWDIGGNPRQIDWRPGEQSLDEVLARAIRRKKKAEARRRQKDKLAAMVLGVGTGTGEDSEYGPGGHGSSSMAPPPAVRASTQVPQVQTSQMLPRIMVSSSQVDRDRGMSSSMGPVFSSQVTGGGAGASQIRSQVLGAKFGDRKKKKKDVKKRTGGFR